jgi:hypothetical protein
MVQPVVQVAVRLLMDIQAVLELQDKVLQEVLPLVV